MVRLLRLFVCLFLGLAGHLILPKEILAQTSTTKTAKHTSAQTTAGSLLINEIVTDPQQDLNDSSGGNGIPFDETPGNGTITTTDEWLELYNKSAFAFDLTEGSGWSLEFVNGTNTILNLASPGTETFMFSNGGSLANFQPRRICGHRQPSGSHE